MNDLILQPVILMCLLSFVMMLWMYATRVPASKEIEKKGVNLQDLSHPSKLGGVFPSKVERVADNYNHLFEQPTVFYALSFVIWALNMTDSIYLICAWLYFVIRLVHSVFQATLNLVWVRFGLFIFSWLILAVMIFKLIFSVFL
tara:strand:+ start:3223 stop:3654 length:432 start_codon:yes stop_codon:yes gene_type:complete